MPTRNVDLTEQLDNFIIANVENGRYGDANDVVRTALRELEREQQADDAKLIALRAALADGAASGWVEGDPFERVLAELGLSLEAN